MSERVTNPFVGMRAFDFEQRALFFGRERQVYGLYRLMTFGFIAVIGASGSGKSSLVRAGLLPLLHDRSERRRWQIATTTPGAEPIERLADAVVSLAPMEDDDARTIRRDRVVYLLRRSSVGLAEALDEMPELADRSLLIVIDQFEEVFRGIGPERRDEIAGFVQLLLHLHRHRPTAHVLVTMRSDFIGDCAQFPGLSEAVSDTQFLVPSLTRAQRDDTISKPLALTESSMETPLVERLLNDAGFENDQLPVLQHALTQMWIAASQREGVRVGITQGDYDEVGKLEGAISKHANAVMAELPGREACVEAVFRSLSERDADGRAVRRSLTLREIIAETGLREDDVRAVVDRFRADDCAFLVSAKGALTLDDRVDVVHEALLRRWDRVHSVDPARPGWLDREDEDGRYYRSLLIRIDGGESALPVDRVTERDAWWTSRPRTSAWADRYGGRRERVEAFFVASRAALVAHGEAREKQERTRRRFLIFAGTVTVLALSLLALTFFALVGSERTTNASLVTQSSFLSRDSQSDDDRGDAADGTLLALQALPRDLAHPDRPFTRVGYGALTDALANLRELHTYRTDGLYTHVRYLADERHFIVWQDNGTIEFWSRGASRPDRILRSRAWVRKVALSQDGRFLASGDNEGYVDVWALRSSSTKPFESFRLQDAAVDVAFRDDGRWLIAATNDRTSVFDLLTRKRIRFIAAGTNWAETDSIPYGNHVLLFGTRAITLWNRTFTRRERVFGPRAVSAALSADGRRCVVFDSDGSIAVLNTTTMRAVARLRDSGGQLDAGISGDGKTIFAIHGSYVRFWDVPGARLLSTVPIATGFEIEEISFDGREFALGSNQGAIEIWSTRYGARLLVLGGYEGFMISCEFNRDGSRLIASANDGTAREWDVRSHVETILNDDAFVAGRHVTDALDVSRDGRWIAIGSQYDVRIYDAATGTLRRTLRRPDREAPASESTAYFYVAFGPDGREVALSSNAYVGATIWNWRTGAVIRRIRGASPLRFLAFSRDGKRLASSEKDQAITLHDLQSGAVGVVKANAFDSTVTSLAFARNDDRLFVTLEGGSVRIFDGDSRTSVGAFAVQSYVTQSDVSPDGRLIATASRDETVRVWDVRSGSLVAVRRYEEPFTVHFSNDGKRLVVAAQNRLEIWDIATDRTVLNLRGYENYVYRAQYADHDRRVVSTGIDKMTRLWSLPQLPSCQGAIDEARRLVPHELSAEASAAEFITPRRPASFLAPLIPQEKCR